MEDIRAKNLERVHKVAQEAGIGNLNMIKTRRSTIKREVVLRVHRISD